VFVNYTPKENWYSQALFFSLSNDSDDSEKIARLNSERFEKTTSNNSGKRCNTRT